MDNEVESMLQSDKFDLTLALWNGVWQLDLDLVCRDENCNQCPFSTKKDITYHCNWEDVSEERVGKHIVSHHPKKLLKLIREMKVPEPIGTHWIKEIQKEYSLSEYPELWV